MLSFTFNPLAGTGRSRSDRHPPRRSHDPQAWPDLPRAPDSADWMWAPDLRLDASPTSRLASGSALRPGLTAHHDGPADALRLDPLPDTGFRLSPSGFRGGFLSLALDLPGAALDGLRRHHVLGLAACFDLRGPQKVYGRLNILHGPNTEALLGSLRREPAVGPGQHLVEFELFDRDLDIRRLSRAWIDLIFESPGDSAVQVNAIGIYRRPRAVL